MKRRLSLILTCLSLMLFIALAALWIRSHWDSDLIARENSAGDVFGLQTHPGGIEWSRHPATFVVWQGSVWSPGKGRWAFSTSRLGESLASPVFLTSAVLPAATNGSGISSGTFTLIAPSPQGMTIGVTPVMPSLGAPPAQARFLASGSGTLSGTFTFSTPSATSKPILLTSPTVATSVFPQGLAMAGGPTYMVSGVVTGGGGGSTRGVGTGLGALPTPSYLTLTITSVVWTPPANHLLGFGYETTATLPGSLSVASGSRVSVRVAAPFWFFLLLTGTLPGLWVARKVRIRRRVRAGMCTACGYDLRATPGRCPECGKSHRPNPKSQ